MIQRADYTLRTYPNNKGTELACGFGGEGTGGGAGEEPFGGAGDAPKDFFNPAFSMSCRSPILNKLNGGRLHPEVLS